MRQNLEEQKRQFVNNLNKRDPNWEEKVRLRKEQEIQIMQKAEVQR